MNYNLLILAIIIWILGYIHNGRFVRPRWKVPGKFIFYVGISYILINEFGMYSLIFIVGHPLIGLTFHTILCKKHNINWLTCEPSDIYLQQIEKWSKVSNNKH